MCLLYRRVSDCEAELVTINPRHRVFTDEQWERIEPLLPSNTGKRARPFENNRRIVEGIAYRYRAGIAWRDLPREHFGPWQTVWKRHRRYAADGTRDRVLAQILADADATGDWDDQSCSPAGDKHPSS